MNVCYPYFEQLLKYMDSIKDKPEKEQLELIRKELESMAKADKGGWL